MSPTTIKENPSVFIINRLEALNEFGCSYFLEANEFHQTIMTSAELRWLNIRLKKGEFLKRQQEAYNHIEEIANLYGENTPKLNMQILLYRNPLKISDNKHIVQLIKAGADIRYKKMDKTVRICLRDNTLFLSYSHDTKKTVNVGIKYISKTSNDPVISNHISTFKADFESAKRLIVKDNKLLFFDKWYLQLSKSIKEITIKDGITLIIGAGLGGLVSKLITLLF